jgi:GNAT superfamily N-acetyltransferase
MRVAEERNRLTRTGLETKRVLDDSDLDQIRQLVEVCNRADDLSVKFNWEMMSHRDPAHVNDFCYYHDGHLVGYMPLDAFGDEFEITGLVQPSHRRQGIFRRLFEAARQEARHRQAKQLLLVNYRASASGTAMVKRLGLAYHFSEYRMEADAATIPPLPVSQIGLEEVTEANVGELSRLLAINFEATEWNSAPSLLKELTRDGRRYYLARLDRDVIGHVGVLTGAGNVYIRAVGILPDWRRQGYGRQLLATILQKLLSEGHTQFELDVATENSNALTLYQACGFRETTVYDYYLAD